MTKDEFIDRSEQKHNNKYDYSKVNYINANTKVCIICPIHGEFWQRPINHYKRGHGCPKCSQKHNYTTEEWVTKAKSVCGDIYDWSKVSYINNHTKVTLICKVHGEFNIRPNCLLNGQRCPLCAKKQVTDALSSDKIEFIKKANNTHNNCYDYSEVNYINSHIKVCIICPKHGEFWQKPNTHLSGCGCPKCGFESRSQLRKSKLEDVINNFKIKHNNKYDYSKVVYNNTETKICIICPKHGEFWQTPHSHLNGQGCPKCSRSLMEEDVAKYLGDKNIEYEQQKTFEWLKNKQNLRLDFYLDKYKIAIECQGRQHYESIEGFGGIKSLLYIQANDRLKYELCKMNGIKTYYIKYNEKIDDKLTQILNDIKYVQDTVQK